MRGAFRPSIPEKKQTLADQLCVCMPALCCRLKMGVCEGVPQLVQQDHLGRADYHGAIVNQVRASWFRSGHQGLGQGVRASGSRSGHQGLGEGIRV